MRSCIGVGNINIRIREQDEKDCFCQNIRPLGGGGVVGLTNIDLVNISTIQISASNLTVLLLRTSLFQFLYSVCGW